jgi:hypothetical protein
MNYYVLSPPGMLARFNPDTMEEAVYREGAWVETNGEVGAMLIDGRVELDEVTEPQARAQYPYAFLDHGGLVAR